MTNPSNSPATDDVTNAPEKITISSFQNNQKVSRRLRKMGLANPTKITDTLQGSIWRASYGATQPAGQASKSTSVIKVTNRYLHDLAIGIIGRSAYKVGEDILLEQSILKFLTQHTKCPKSIVKFNAFFKTTDNYYLVMQDGGSCAFDFVRNAHNLIRAKKIAVSEWHKVVKIMFRQIVECIDFMHSKNVAHFDISLENLLINDVKIEIVTNVKSKKSKLKFVTNDIQLKLCDFGLAELFTNEKCLSNKHSGKKQYKSPEVISNKKQFDAKQNDIWCMGVCLFMICTGCPPWEVADKKADKTFNYVMNHSVAHLLKYWKIINIVDANLVDLLDQILQNENQRISLNQIKQHIYYTL